MGHFAYRTLAMCWAAEKQASDVPDETHWPQTELDHFECVAQRLADAARTGIPADGLDRDPESRLRELAFVRDCLQAVND